MLFKLIVLTAQQQMNKDRSISAVYYLLQGKQSIQTIQDAQLFELSHFYGIYKSVPKQKFFEIILELEKEQFLIQQEKDNYYELTLKGTKWLRENEVLLQSLYVNGKKYKQMDDTYRFRLLLLLQVWTNSKKGHFTFIPIIENKEIERWVKSYYKQTKSNIDYYLTKIFDELRTLLLQIPTYRAEIFVSQLTGYKTVGMTTEQIMAKFQLSKEDVHIINVSMIHFILLQINEEKEKYTLLYAISDGLLTVNTLTDSARRTNDLLKKGYTIPQIANNRHLRENTIYDHIVEIALHDEQFPLIEYVVKSTEEQIIQAIENVQSYKLKDIKAAVSEEITYFQIRLVLAKYNG